MAVVVGEAAVQIRAELDASEVERDISGPVGDAAESAGEEGGGRFTAAFGAALAIGGAFASSLETAGLQDKLAAQLGASGQYAEDLGAIAGDLYANAYGDSLGSVNDALRSVIQSGAVMEDASNEQIQSVTASVMDLATAFDQDVGGTSQAVGRLIQQGLAKDANEALDLLTRGFQQGADRGGDLLDVVGEYGTTFAGAGLTGSQSIGLLNQALAAGIPNADFAADAIREFGIIAREGGEDAATALGDLGLNADDVFAAMQRGGPDAAGALDSVLDALRNTDDEALRAQAGATLLGGQFEDLGDALLALDPSEAEASLGTVEGAIGNLSTTLNDNATTNLTTFWRTAQTAFVEIVGGQVVPIVEGVASLLATTLGPALEAVGTFVSGTIVPAFRSMADWIAANQTPVAIVAGLIAAVFVPGLIAMGIQAGINGALVVASWVAQQAAAIGSVAAQSGQIALAIGRFLLLGAQAATSAAVVVAGWVLMGVQSLIQAGRMAAAWLIALGPIGLVIAAVIGIVALIVANWQTIVDWTTAAWNAVVGAIVGAWNWIVGVVTGAAAAVWGAITGAWNTVVALTVGAWQWVSQVVTDGINAVVGFVTGLPGRAVAALSSLGAMIAGVATSAWQWFTGNVITGAQAAINFVTGLPGRILGALGNLGSLLLNAGGDLIRGLVNGISGAASFVGDVAGSIWRAIKGFINSNIIDKLNGLLEFTIAGVTINPPDIPRLHSGGVFDSGRGEGLALLRDDELVATPEQRIVADNLLRSLLAGRLDDDAATRRTTTSTTAGVNVTQHITQQRGEDPAALAARITQGVVWNLSNGITRPVTVAG